MKLNIGVGNIPLEGYKNIDKYYYPGCGRVDLDQSKVDQYDWSYGDAVTLQDPSDTFDEVIMVHVLEHMSMDDGNLAIKQAARVLKPRGVLEIEVPDLAKACWLFNSTPMEDPLWLRVMGLIYGTTGADGEGQFHLTGYTRERLRQKMGEHDIIDIEEIPVGFGHGRPEPEFDFRLRGVKNG